MTGIIKSLPLSLPSKWIIALSCQCIALYRGNNKVAVIKSQVPTSNTFDWALMKLWGELHSQPFALSYSELHRNFMHRFHLK